MLRILLASSLAFVFLAGGAHAAEKSTIKKCQDARGKWHYGDTAAEECAKSKIEVISDQGVKRKEIAAPPTAAEIKARAERADEEERAKQQAADQKKKDDILLATYAVEADIVYARDRKLAQLEQTIKATEDTLKSLHKTQDRVQKQQADEEQKTGKTTDATAKQLTQIKSQIATREIDISNKRKEQETIRKDSESELARYRELKSKSSIPPAASTQKKP
jgi:hypothetical protein